GAGVDAGAGERLEEGGRSPAVAVRLVAVEADHAEVGLALYLLDPAADLLEVRFVRLGAHPHLIADDEAEAGERKLVRVLGGLAEAELEPQLPIRLDAGSFGDPLDGGHAALVDDVGRLVAQRVEAGAAQEVGA